MTTSMQTEELGKLLLVGLSGPTLTGNERELLGRLSPAGIILFRKNIVQDCGEAWMEPLQELLADVRAALGRDRFVISIDHEGGRVHRLSSPVTHFPAAGHWGSSVAEVTRAMVRELQALGCNLTFAPVADIHLELSNPVIGKRSFGSSPESVAEQVEIAISVMNQLSMVSCAKHFPGHGATTTDSHFELPLLDISADLLRQRELVPFRRAIQAGVPMVMSAHVFYPQIDPSAPATFSRTLLTELLRVECGFQGVIITDDIEMNALQPRTAEERAVLALGAGADLILEGYPASGLALETAARMVDAIDHALRRGELSESALRASGQRVDSLLARLPQFGARNWLSPVEVQQHSELARALHERAAVAEGSLVVD